MSCGECDLLKGMLLVLASLALVIGIPLSAAWADLIKARAEEMRARLKAGGDADEPR